MTLADLISSPQRYTFDSRDPAVIAAADGDPNSISDLSEVVSVDVTMSEDYEFSFEVSDNPVESGIDVTDHKRAKPIMLRMSGIVSDSPNDIFDVLSGNTAGTLAGIVGLGDQTTRSQDAYQRLRAMAERTEPITVITQFDEFKNMTFTNFTPRKDDAGKYVGFSAVLKEVRFAKPLFGTFTPEVEHTAAPTSAALKPPEPLAENPKDLLERSVDFVRGKPYREVIVKKASDSRDYAATKLRRGQLVEIVP